MKLWEHRPLFYIECGTTEPDRCIELCIMDKQYSEDGGISICVEISLDEESWLTGGEQAITSGERIRRLEIKALECGLITQEWIDKAAERRKPNGKVVNEKKINGVPKGFPKGYKQGAGWYYRLNKKGEVVRVRNIFGYDISDWLTVERFWHEMKLFGGR